ncbi:MAG: HAMP domain-containing protein [Nitrospina sp.]|jgi:two-component system, OmpR family, phosphate regulon sensor histidine kinase PhoR|nr:HAMP domain-containing protein [Nitrospina sp.]MBT5633245.1 HAMP domain-containing protein [Nitrospina sp.]
MVKKRILWQLFPTYLLITLTAILAVGWFSVNSLRDFYYDRTAEDLKNRAWLVEHQVLKTSPSLESDLLNKLSHELGNKTDTRITIIDLSGKVLGDSHEDPSRMNNHSDRPEFIFAMKGEFGTSIRFSNTLEERMMYIAVPLIYENSIKGVVRTSIPVTFIDHALRSIEVKIASASLLVSLLVAGISLMVSRRISRPIEKMKSAAESISKGDWSDEISVQSDSLEISALADALNQMVTQLDKRIHTITAQRNEREAVLSSMVEGVLAVDAEEKLISMNHAAAKLIGVDPKQAEGRSVQEVVRNPTLLKFVQQTLQGRENAETDLAIGNENEKYLQAHGAVLHDSLGEAVGAVIVLNDITRIRRLETVRRDFVANVSHELKTPITLIKGFVETLQQGALQNKEEAERFLQIMAKQVDRLNAIIEDLLTLSRLEQNSENSEMAFENTGLKNLLESVIRDCEWKASDNSASIHLICDEDLLAPVNPPLMSQAVINLVDNALKYSGPDKQIEIKVSKNKTEVIIEVMDHGCGIDSAHLPRLFERFYRVDEARSRKLGGTGLGLAIVKHIAQAHGGKVSAQSRLGKGSQFSIHLPIR